MALYSEPGDMQLSLPFVNNVPIHEWALLTKDFHSLQQKFPCINAIETFRVPISTIDLFNFPNVPAMKLDAEGAEYAVLKGARRTLIGHRPVLSVEIEERHARGSTWSVPAYLDALDYEGYFEYRRSFFPIKLFDRETMQVASESPGETTYSNPYIWVFFFIPRERNDLQQRLDSVSMGGIQYSL